MARIRTVKPEFWSSPGQSVCKDPYARLLFIAMWNWADDHGRGTANARELAGFAFPWDEEISSADIRRMLGGIRRGFGVVFYEVEGRPYYYIPSWEKHQKIDKRSSPKYPGPEDGRPWDPDPTQPPDQPKRAHSENSTEPSAGSAETPPNPRRDPGAGTGEQGNRGTGEKVNPSALAPLDASEGAQQPSAVDDEPLDGVLVDDTPGPVGLFVVPDPTPSTDLAVPETANAGQINRQWIDYCAANGVKLTTRAIKRYGMHIKDALNQGFSPDLIKHALGEMMRDRVVSRTSLFDNYLIRAQQGPERPPARMSRAEESITRHAPAGLSAGDLVREALTRPA